MKNQEPKIALVTGGNRGIGYAITQCQASVRFVLSENGKLI